MRPITGDKDPIGAVHDFMRDNLKLSESFMDCVGPITVRRIPSGPAARIKNEAIVVFQSTDIRDAVRGAARNLAGKGSDYGIRLELPNHLKSAMKVLQSVSYDLKQRHPESRRNVLFDDEAMDLVLDVCIDGQTWRRITTAQAKTRSKKTKAKKTSDRMNLDEEELDKLLDGSTDGSEGEEVFNAE